MGHDYTWLWKESHILVHAYYYGKTIPQMEAFLQSFLTSHMSNLTKQLLYNSFHLHMYLGVVVTVEG